MASKCTGPCLGYNLDPGHTTADSEHIWSLCFACQPPNLSTRWEIAGLCEPQNLLRTGPHRRLGQEGFLPVSEDRREPNRTWPLFLAGKKMKVTYPHLLAGVRRRADLFPFLLFVSKRQSRDMDQKEVLWLEVIPPGAPLIFYVGFCICEMSVALLLSGPDTSIRHSGYRGPTQKCRVRSLLSLGF